MATTATTNQESIGVYSETHLIANLGKLCNSESVMANQLASLRGLEIMALALLTVGEAIGGTSSYGSTSSSSQSFSNETNGNTAFTPAADWVNAINDELDGGDTTKKSDQQKEASVAHNMAAICENQGKSIITALKSMESSLDSVLKSLTQIAQAMGS